MAQYTVGHPARQAELEARLAQIPGLYVAGNAYQGIGIPDCIRMGRAAAEKILDWSDSDKIGLARYARLETGAGSMSSVDVGSVSYRQDFQASFDVSENDPVLVNAQPIAALPFAVHRFNVSRIRFAKVGDAFENA
jgi:hypothetical protein